MLRTPKKSPRGERERVRILRRPEILSTLSITEHILPFAQSHSTRRRRLLLLLTLSSEEKRPQKPFCIEITFFNPFLSFSTSIGNSQRKMEGGLKPMDAEQLRENAHKMVDFIADYYKNIESFPVLSQVQPGYLHKLLPDSAPNQPESLQDVLDDVQTKILPGVTHWQSPDFFAYFPSNGSVAGFLGEMLSAGINMVGFSWITSPAATELEMIVLDWLAKLLKLPEDFLSTGQGGGVIQGTASEAVLVVLLAARDRVLRRVGKDAIGKLVVYASDQTHSALQKACQV